MQIKYLSRIYLQKGYFRGGHVGETQGIMENSECCKHQKKHEK